MEWRLLVSPMRRPKTLSCEKHAAMPLLKTLLYCHSRLRYAIQLLAMNRHPSGSLTVAFGLVLPVTQHLGSHMVKVGMVLSRKITRDQCAFSKPVTPSLRPLITNGLLAECVSPRGILGWFDFCTGYCWKQGSLSLLNARVLSSLHQYLAPLHFLENLNPDLVEARHQWPQK